jgi:Tetrapyrrole (Corrin/Porphyrin) Methylases
MSDTAPPDTLPPAAPRTPHIYIAGLGLQTVTQITREVQDACRGSAEILYVDTGIATRTFLETLCPRVTPLFDESYARDASRVSAYHHMAARVVEAALDHPPVTFALHGHPLVAALPPFLVLELAAALDLRVTILPGVSALDALLADLRLDPVVHGIQMYEATDVLLRRRPLQSDVPAILWQIGPIETCLHSQAVSLPGRFARLIAHLRQFYPARHEVVAIHCSPHPIVPATILRFALEDMGGHAAEIHGGFTLYVPPAGARAVLDRELVGKLYSVEHLRSVTRA